MAEWIYFLHPPRERFAETMSEHERSVFAEHRDYLDGRLAQGSLILAGPTLGEHNTGIAVFEAGDEDEARAVMEADPAIAKGVVRGELRPFPQPSCAGAPEGVDAIATSAPSGLVATLLELLEAVRSGELEPQDGLERLRRLPYDDLGFARVDTHRELRQGAGEGVLAQGKTAAEVTAIVRALLDGGAGSVMVTRADAAVRAAVLALAPDAGEHERARAVWVTRQLPALAGAVTIVSGGTADGPALHEARIRAELLGVAVHVHEDIGVAGLHRLAPALDDLRGADCVIVVAGQDAALASVVGGITAAPVIGVPTSTGYGTALGGVTPLLAMLSSCAAGLAVVGIDDGFGAGTIAARIARAAAGAT